MKASSKDRTIHLVASFVREIKLLCPAYKFAGRWLAHCKKAIVERSKVDKGA